MDVITMQSNFPPDAEARLGAQEEMSTILHARLFEIKRDNAAIKADVQELKADVQELKRDNVAIKVDIQELKGSVNDRFDHVYGELADLKANVIEIRNIVVDQAEIKNMLATIITK